MGFRNLFHLHQANSIMSLPDFVSLKAKPWASLQCCVLILLKGSAGNVCWPGAESKTTTKVAKLTGIVRRKTARKGACFNQHQKKGWTFSPEFLDKSLKYWSIQSHTFNHESLRFQEETMAYQIDCSNRRQQCLFISCGQNCWDKFRRAELENQRNKSKWVRTIDAFSPEHLPFYRYLNL